jgi:hypothetical protein
VDRVDLDVGQQQRQPPLGPHQHDDDDRSGERQT